MAQRQLVRPFLTTFRCMSGGEYGSGSGKGGGSGGSIRDAGGAFGKMEAAREEEYFHKFKQAQLKELRGQLAREVEHHENQQKNREEKSEEDAPEWFKEWSKEWKESQKGINSSGDEQKNHAEVIARHKRRMEELEAEEKNLKK